MESFYDGQSIGTWVRSIRILVGGLTSSCMRSLSIKLGLQDDDQLSGPFVRLFDIVG